MDLRKSFAKPFKTLKARLPRGSRKRDGRSGNEIDREDRAGDAEGSKARQQSPYLHPGIEDTTEGESHQEGSDIDGKRASLVDDPPTATPLTLESKKLDSM